jgi:hypothetical protein
VLAAKYPNEAAGGCGRSGSVAARAGTRRLNRAHGQNQCCSIPLPCVGRTPVEIHHYMGNGRLAAVQAHAHGAHSIMVDGNVPLPGPGQGVRQDQHQPVRMAGSSDGGIDTRAEPDFDLHAAAPACYFHVLYGREPRRVALPSRHRNQQEEHPELFLYPRHSPSSLAGAPLAARILCSCS